MTPHEVVNAVRRLRYSSEPRQFALTTVANEAGVAVSGLYVVAETGTISPGIARKVGLALERLQSREGHIAISKRRQPVLEPPRRRPSGGR
jgi:hypothetical protein